MRARLAIFLTLGLVLCGCKDEAAVDETPLQASPPTTKPTEKTPVQGATLAGQGFDTDGDGKVDTWRELDPNTGEQIEAKDTDGDGLPDTWNGVKTNKEPPPGFVVPDDALQELNGPPDDLGPPPSDALPADIPAKKACSTCGEPRGDASPCPHCGMD